MNYGEGVKRGRRTAGKHLVCGGVKWARPARGSRRRLSEPFLANWSAPPAARAAARRSFAGRRGGVALKK